MMNLRAKTKTNLGLAVTFAVLLGACTSKAIKMEASELALDTPEVESSLVASNDDGTFVEQEAVAPVIAKNKVRHKKAKRKGAKHVAMNAKKSFKKKTVVSAAATVAKEIEAPKMDQELSKYPSNDILSSITIPVPATEVSAALNGEEGSSKTMMFVLAGLLILGALGAFIYKTRFSKSKSRRRLVYNG